MPQGRRLLGGVTERTSSASSIDGTESPGVSKISGLVEGELDTIEQPDGGTDHVYKISAAKVQVRAADHRALRRRQPEDKRFRDWFRADVQAQPATAGRLQPFARTA